MWTETTRVKYERKSGRYASDTTDQEWQWIEPLIEVKEGPGRPRKWPMREIVNALFYILRSGCSWRLLPKDFPPMTTVQLLLRLVRYGLLAEDKSRPGDGSTRGRWKRSEPDRGRD